MVDVFRLLAAVFGLLLILDILWEASETIVMPSRGHRRAPLVWIFMGGGWQVWMTIGRRIGPNRREAFRNFFRRLSVLLIFVP